MNVTAVAAAPHTEVRLALEAMATRFELVLFGDDPLRLRAAGEDALREIAHLDRQLSFYRGTSDVSWINGRAAAGPVRVEPRLFSLLERCQALPAATGGAFDITVAPLMRAWQFVSGPGAVPDAPALAAARACVGFEYLQLDPAAPAVEFRRPGMSIDLGAAGKGYAIDAAVEILREQGVAHALVHGGTSSVHVIGPQPGGEPWGIGWGPPGEPPHAFRLCEGALAVSAIRGKSFFADGIEYGHVMDPRTGRTTTSARAAAVTGPGSLECDALSTALLILGPEWLPTLRSRFPGYDGRVS